MTPATLAPDRAGAVALARTLHDTVVQRLCGLSLLLGVDWTAADARQDLCRREVAAALDELREALDGCLGTAAAGARDDDFAAVKREFLALQREHPDAVLTHTGLGAARTLPPRLRGLLEATVIEGLRNIRKHARPAHIDVDLSFADGLLELAILNDGADGDQPLGEGRRGTGLGLRLLAMEAALLGGTLQSVPDEPSAWKLELVLPVADSAA